MGKAGEVGGNWSVFSSSEGRDERWRELHRVTRALAAGTDVEKLQKEAKSRLAELGPLEELCGYPGPRLMQAVQDRLKDADWSGLARLVQRISISLLSNSYRDDPEAWKSDEDDEAAHVPGSILP